MGSRKGDCKCIPHHCNYHRLRSAFPVWEVHPSWKTAMNSLDTYNHWVSEVIVPIAFQWIEEHKPEVYASVPDQYKDDVGVVMSAAFQLVKQKEWYQEGLEISKKLEREQQNGTLDTAKYNPVWTDIATMILTGIDTAFAKYKDVLKYSGEGDPD